MIWIQDIKFFSFLIAMLSPQKNKRKWNKEKKMDQDVAKDERMTIKDKTRKMLYDFPPFSLCGVCEVLKGG